jgi:hypothetical protein
MPNIAEAWLARSKEILKLYDERHAPEVVPFAVSLLTSLYGPKSPQLEAFNTALAQLAKQGNNPRDTGFYQGQHASIVIKNVVAEAESGLIGSLRAQVTGEILSELVALGKEILSDGTESAKNVSAVLIAAAFEDLMRRMGSELARVVGRPKLEDVLTALKNAGVLKGGEVGTAQSYLKFRNDSLHADWIKVQQSQVQSCIAFLEALLLKHFS